MMPKILIYPALAAIIAAAAFFGYGGKGATSSNTAPSGLPVIPVTITNSGDQTFKITAEVATTAEDQETGLMNRKSLGEDEGMLFVYDNEQTLAFWMKNTLISLDMIFIDSGKTIVDINHSAEPGSIIPYVSQAPAKYVLEVNGGYCNSNNIKAGDRVYFSGY
ncbi:MAG: DUF192 domain-containing protein [bacterium]